MKSRWIINIFLLLAIGALTLVARYEPGIEEPAKPQPITAIEESELRSIRVERPLREDLLLTRDGTQQWMLAHEPKLPADSFQVHALARLAEQTPVRSYRVDQLDLTRLELEPPYATVFLDDQAVQFGKLEPLEGLRYVRVNDTVHLISDLYQYLIEADAIQFVQRRLFSDNADIRSIRLPEWSLSRREESWRVEPGDDTLSADDLQQLVDAWRGASALHLQQASGDEQGETVEVRTGENGQLTRFLMTAREPELVLVRPDLGLVYRMGNRLDDLLTLPSKTDTPGD